MSIKVYVSKTQLKKFKITADNCDLYMRLERSGHAEEYAEEWAQAAMQELDRFGIQYSVVRKGCQ